MPIPHLRILSLVLTFLMVERLSAFPISYPTDSDSLVLIEDIKFKSEYEKQIFLDLLAGEKMAYEVMMSVSEESNAKSIALDKHMLANEIGRLKQIPVPANKKKQKYYKKIYEEVHERFLMKYELQNHFSQVFTTGEYNCVTACALYALIFDELKIDYVLKETPTHVYIIIEPEGDQFLIETTDPVGGFNKFSGTFKSQYVKQLGELKLISEAEIRNGNTEDLFEEYYFKSVVIGLNELVADHYWNDALYQMKEDNYDAAMGSLQKSFLLYPNEKTREVLLAVIALKATNTDYAQIEDGQVLVLLSRFNEDEIDDDDLVSEFLKMNNTLLIEQGETKLYEEAYENIMANISRESAKKEVSYFYNYENARFLFNKGNYSQGIVFATSAFALKENNADAETLMLSTLGQILNYETDHQKAFNMIEQISVKHPILFENNKFGGVYLNYNMIRMADYYKANKLADGNYHREKFEKIYDEKPHYMIDQQLVGHAYSQLAVYHFKRSQYTSARKVINKGLEYAPGNSELLARKRAL